MSNIYWAGDSTVKQNDITTYPQMGIGQMFHLFVKRGVLILNHAENGRSTKSFLDEGRLEPIVQEISTGDFFFIQFGHNDEKKADPSRYTDPFTTYIENLGIFARTARRKGALPVFITPLERRCFDEDGRLGLGDHSDYVAAMKQAAIQYHVPLVDLYTASRRELKAAGAEESEKWYMHLAPGQYPSYPDGKTDNTHLRCEGCVVYGRCIAQGLYQLGGPYAELLTVRL